ncbi:MAG: hypothetical protein Q8928_07235 [Bacteroidota bacterium]|nr:hypothetical protein [Bacteroidota bacterium]
MSNILIVSNHFYPEITPRAFRTTELAKEFANQGHDVTVILPYKLDFVDPAKIRSNWNFKIEICNKTKSIKNKIFRKIIENRVTNYFFPFSIFGFINFCMIKKLMSTNENFDILYSISYPYGIHLNCIIGAILNSKLRKVQTKFAEFSDPMFNGYFFKKAFIINYLFYYLFAIFFDFFVTPTKNTYNLYKNFKRKEKILIIPQGFNFDEIILLEYKKNEVPTFAYAGIFYEKLRDPGYFLNFLTTVKTPFKFHLFIDNNYFFRNMIIQYNTKIKGEIIIHDFLTRIELIKGLSQMDFLINFDNENSKMVPSKLIDYAQTKRPILSFNSKTFTREKFIRFMHGDYNDGLNFDLNDYNIKNIVNNIISITKR